MAPTHSSEEPFALSCIVPGGWKRLKKGGCGVGGRIQRASGSDTQRVPLRWPGVATGQPHWGFQVRSSPITPAETMSGNDAEDPSASNDNSYIIQHLSLGCTVISSLVGDPRWLSDGGRTIAGPHFVFEKCSCFHDIASKEG